MLGAPLTLEDNVLEKVDRPEFDNEKARHITESLLSVFRKRKTTRYFQRGEVDEQIVLNAISIAGTAPSGANKQPWSFALIKDQSMKQEIRERAELEETLFYKERAPQKWLNDLKPLHTNEKKEFITEANFLIPVFCKQYDFSKDNEKTNNYYVKESVGLATGFLISALHMAGLSVLTYTPSNRNFLVDFLERPRNERTFMVLAVGRPSEHAMAPVISKKALDEILTVYGEVRERTSYSQAELGL